jgi:hypothetical protein
MTARVYVFLRKNWNAGDFCGRHSPMAQCAYPPRNYHISCLESIGACHAKHGGRQLWDSFHMGLQNRQRM